MTRQNKFKCKDQEVATGEVGKAEIWSGESGEEKEPKRLKTEAKLAELAKKAVQGLAELDSQVRTAESVNFECIKTCETDPIPQRQNILENCMICSWNRQVLKLRRPGFT